MTQSNTTRRAILSAATTALACAGGAAIVSAGLVGAGQAKGEVRRISPELARLLDEHARADAAIDHWYQTTWNPIVEAHSAAVEELEATSPVVVSVPAFNHHLDGFWKETIFSTASRADVARCRGIVSIPCARQNQGEGWQNVYKAARKIVAAVKRKERKKTALDRKFAISSIRDHEDVLWKPIHAATAAIIAFPIANAADLGAKLDHMHQVGTCENDAEEFHQIVRADVRRLAGEEA